MLFDYDNRDIESIFKYAKKLESLTFRDIGKMFSESDRNSYINPYDTNYINYQTSSFTIREPEVGYITNPA